MKVCSFFPHEYKLVCRSDVSLYELELEELNGKNDKYLVDCLLHFSENVLCK